MLIILIVQFIYQKKLSNKPAFIIKCKVAENPNCPVHILEKLANGREALILSVIKNINCPGYILEKLVKLHLSYRTFGIP